MGAVRRLVDADTGEAIPYAPYAFSGEHIQVDKARVEAITESKEFTPSQKFMVLWWIGVSSPGHGAVEGNRRRHCQEGRDDR